jgi:hypothetical protein
VNLLGRDEREAVGQVEAHLVAEDRKRARAGAIVLAGAMFADAPQEVEVGLHAGRTPILADGEP